MVLELYEVFRLLCLYFKYFSLIQHFKVYFLKRFVLIMLFKSEVISLSLKTGVVVWKKYWCLAVFIFFCWKLTHLHLKIKHLFFGHIHGAKKLHLNYTRHWAEKIIFILRGRVNLCVWKWFQVLILFFIRNLCKWIQQDPQINFSRKSSDLKV